MGWRMADILKATDVELDGFNLIPGYVYETNQQQKVTPLTAISDYKIGLDGYKYDYVIMIISGTGAGKCYNPSHGGITYKLIGKEIVVSIH